jgi:hypothetical protein
MKKYRVVHTNQQAAKLHTQRIKQRGAKVEVEKEGNKTIVHYYFPDNKR